MEAEKASLATAAAAAKDTEDRFRLALFLLRFSPRRCCFWGQPRRAQEMQHVAM